MRRLPQRVAVLLVGLLAAGGLQALDDDPTLYAVGALGASSLYTSYFLLGTLADGFASGTYSAAFADELARDVIGLGESSIAALRRLRTDETISGDDRTLVDEMIRVHGLLIDQAWGLIAYLEGDEDAEAWFRSRRAAWEAIRALLVIE